MDDVTILPVRAYKRYPSLGARLRCGQDREFFGRALRAALVVHRGKALTHPANVPGRDDGAEIAQRSRALPLEPLSLQATRSRQAKSR